MTSIKIIDKNYFTNTNLDLFINIVYDNFFDIANKPELKHSPKEINRLLKSNKFRGIIAKKDNKTIGYLLGEVHSLPDERIVFFINYLYVARRYRKNGIASKMLDMIILYIKENNIDTIMLNCDTNNKQVFDFYSKRGFMLDLILRRYTRYDVLSMRV